MPVTFDPFTGPGSTPARRRFWDNVMIAAHASRKLPGQNVKVYEDPTGSVISVPDSRKKGSECPCLTVTFDSVLIDCACYVPPGGGLSQLYTDGGNFNGIT